MFLPLKAKAGKYLLARCFGVRRRMEVFVPRKVKIVASTRAPNAHTDPRSIPENFLSDTRLWIFRLKKDIMTALISCHNPLQSTTPNP